MSRPLRAATAAAAALLVAACVATPASAIVLIDTSFDAADGYVDGPLRFQSGNEPVGGWLGQFNDTTMNPSVDSVAGTVNVISGSPSGTPSGDAFLRNLWNAGATGGTAGGGVAADETGAGFQQGDRIKIDLEYQFELPAGAANIAFFEAGVRDCFSSCGFDAAPVAGFNAAYNSFEDGTVKVFTNLDRAGFRGSDNPFALFLPSADIGLDNGFSGSEPVDLVSDNLLFSYEAELVDAENDQWMATEMTVTNLDTMTVVGQASIDDPDALEGFVYNTEVDNPFTPDIDEGGVAVQSGTEMYGAIRWIDDTGAGTSASSGGYRFEYLPNLPAVPGDYNGDGNVDAADYTVWRDSNESIGVGLPADGTGDDLLGTPDGDVDDFDRQFWAANYGATNTPAAASAIPEPSTLLLGVLVSMAAATHRR